jgi:hypothetical protein
MTPEDTEKCPNCEALAAEVERLRDHTGMLEDAVVKAEAEIAERKLVEEDLLKRKNAATEIGQELSRQKMRAEAEVNLLRRVVRYADFFVEAGQSSAYDEARAALTEFDKAAQEVIVSAYTGLTYERIK